MLTDLSPLRSGPRKTTTFDSPSPECRSAHDSNSISFSHPPTRHPGLDPGSRFFLLLCSGPNRGATQLDRRRVWDLDGAVPGVLNSLSYTVVLWSTLRDGTALLLCARRAARYRQRRDRGALPSRRRRVSDAWVSRRCRHAVALGTRWCRVPVAIRGRCGRILGKNPAMRSTFSTSHRPQQGHPPTQGVDENPGPGRRVEQIDYESRIRADRARSPFPARRSPASVRRDARTGR